MVVFGSKVGVSHPGLSLKELITMIDGAVENGGLVTGNRNSIYELAGCSSKETWDFATASSEFYPELKRWYDEVNLEWLAEYIDKEADEEDEAG